MAKQRFIQKRFSEQNLRLLGVAERILSEYGRQGLDLSLRQLYYQFVSTAYDEMPDSWIDPKTKSKNNDKSYDKLGTLISNGRDAGLIDWDMIQDRGRRVNRLAMWDDPVDRLEWAAKTHRLNKWMDQPRIVWAMIEKEALEGVFLQICHQLEIPLIANKGYCSASTIHGIGREFYELREDHGKEIHVLYLGDHDPSGLDMTNDIQARLEMYSEGPVEVHRLALNFDQVQQYNPPPNPAKQTDSRYKGYVRKWGEECWELDALRPNTLTALVRAEVEALRDDDIWAESMERQDIEKDQLTDLAERVDNGKVKLGDF